MPIGSIPTLEHLTCLDATPTGNPILDQALAHIANSGQPKDTRGWIETLAGQDTAEIRQQALASLIERGILEAQDKKFLWVFRARRYPTIDGRVEREVRLRISDVLLSDDIPDPRDVAMICLVDASGFLRDIFTSRELERATPRVEQLRKMGPDRPRSRQRDCRNRAVGHDGHGHLAALSRP